MPTTFLTPEEYLEQERRAEYKSEYFQGETFAMAGASPHHARRVEAAVEGSTVSASDMRLRVTSSGLSTIAMSSCPEYHLAAQH
jgi:hypothetical protein